MSPVVGVVVSGGALDGRWITDLADLLPECEVVDAETQADEVEILVVGNPPASILSFFPRLRFVQSVWAGPDRLREHPLDVPVARMVAPGLVEYMAEFVSMAVMMLHRQVPAYRRAQAARRWQPLPAMPARSRRVGVLGYGELGRPAASRLAEAGFDVVAWARSPRNDPIPVLTGQDGYREVLARSEILVDVLPLPDHTDRAGVSASQIANRGTGRALPGRDSHIIDPLELRTQKCASNDKFDW